MTNLVKQPSLLPTRKLMAVIIAGAVVGGVQSGLALAWPDHPFTEALNELNSWVQYGVMVLAGYMTKNRAVNVASE